MRILTSLDGRSARTKALAKAAEFEDAGTLDAMVCEADLVLSIMPPSAALGAAEAIAGAMRSTGQTPHFADCNAVSPATVQTIGYTIEGAGAPFIDAGIVGPSPGKGNQPTRFYASGAHAETLMALDGEGIAVRPLDGEIGTASALKMCYAAVTKGSWTLYTAALTTAEVLGLTKAYLAELESSRPHVAAEMRNWVPRLPVDAGRWIGEMEEIAATLGGAGLPQGFHEGAADLFRLLEKTPIADETRETIDPDRTLEDVLAIYADVFGRKAGKSANSLDLVAKPLNASAFAPYGEVLDLSSGTPGTRESFAAEMDNLREDAKLNVSVTRAKETAVPLKVEWMERHPFSGQTFVPVNISRYLMLVAPSNDAGEPNLDALEAFVAAPNQGINYRAGVWHHPFAALDRPAECVVFRFDNGSERDTDWFEVAEGPVVGVET